MLDRKERETGEGVGGEERRFFLGGPHSLTYGTEKVK